MSWFTQREKKEASKLEQQSNAATEGDYTTNWNNANNTGIIYKDEVFESIPFTRQRVVKADDQVDPPDEKSYIDPAAGPDVDFDNSPRPYTPRTPRFNKTPSYSSSNPVNHLMFDSDFESGNLSTACRVYGRSKLMQGHRCMCASNVPFIGVEERNCTPQIVDQEYDLQLSYDLHTTGNIQWYYFSASTPPSLSGNERHDAGGNKASSGTSTGPRNTPRLPGETSTSPPPPLGFHPSSISPITYPLTVRFNIVNMMKTDALYNYGMKPAVYSERENSSSTTRNGSSNGNGNYNECPPNKGWKHAGDCVCYFKNSRSYMKKRKEKMSRAKYYTLSFTYTFEGPDTVYFAHCFPYTYTKLEHYLSSLESDRRVATFLRRKLLCYTLANNRCDLLTITSPSSSHSDMMRRPVIAVSARVHPGETNSSYMMEGFLDFLTSIDPVAQLLRDSFVFKVVPMLNPDGVIHGNYRCSLAGVDLNRKYNHPDPLLHPTIFSMKNLLMGCQKDRGILLYTDLHGHSQNKNTFLYGCDPLQSNIRRVTEGVNKLTSAELTNYSIFPRIFPKVLVSTSNLFASDKALSMSVLRSGTIKHSGNPVKPRPSQSLGQFSYKDCSLKVQKSKAGTGRVVSWCDVGINAAYTVEISFCGSGNNRERKLIKSYAQQRSKNLNSGNEEVILVNEKLRGILKTYQTEKHYSQECLRDLGSQLCLAIASYCNLGSTAKDGADKGKQDKLQQQQSDEVDNDDLSVGNDSKSNNGDEEDEAQDLALELPHLHEIDAAEDLHLPFLLPSVISDKLISVLAEEDSSAQYGGSTYITDDSGRTQSNSRIEAEVALRKCIRVVGGAERAPQSNNTETTNKPTILPSEPTRDNKKSTKSSAKGNKKRKNKPDEDTPVYHFSLSYAADEGDDSSRDDDDIEDVGSDSDPSGDEATPHTLSLSKPFMKLSSSLKNGLRGKQKGGKGGKKRRLKKRKDKSEHSGDRPRGRSSPAPHRVAIAESALLQKNNSTAYNQTISTSARRSTSIRIQRLSMDPTGKRVVQSYHSFQDLSSTEVAKPSLQVTSLTAQASNLSKSNSFHQVTSSQSLPSSRPTMRVAKPRNILTPDPFASESPREKVDGVHPSYQPATSVMDAVRQYKASVRSPPLSPPRERVSSTGSGGGSEIGIASKVSSRDRERVVFSQLPPPRSPSVSSPHDKVPVFPRPSSSPNSSPKKHALMSSSSKKLLMRSSELETLQRLANMDLGGDSSYL